MERWWWRGVKVWCERSRLGMRTRGYQLVRGSLCPISGVRGRVPRVETPVTSLASSLPGGLGDQGYLLLPPSPPPLTPPQISPRVKTKQPPPHLPHLPPTLTPVPSLILYPDVPPALQFGCCLCCVCGCSRSSGELQVKGWVYLPPAPPHPVPSRNEGLRGSPSLL